MRTRLGGLVVALLAITAPVQGSALTIEMPARALREISGLVAATRHEGLWALTDSGTRAHLYAIGLDGQLLNTARVRGVRNQDWESLALWRRAEANWLVIGDIGDNRARRETVTVHLLPEPEAGAQIADVTATLTLTYPDGPRDAEAMAVDSRTATLYVLSKRDEPPRLYSAPLGHASARLTLKALPAITTVPTPTPEDLRQDPRYGRLRSQPVGLDVTADGTRLVIGTYKDAYLYARRPDETWTEALSRTPLAVDTPQLQETQAIAFFGNRLITASEGRPALLATTPLP